MSDKITAPFSPEQVVRLNLSQNIGRMHPFTCPRRGDGNHRVWNGDQGALVATVRGWECPFCDYKQDWAWKFQAEFEP